MTSNGTLIITSLTIEQINAALLVIADRLKKIEERLDKLEEEE
jgi:hypothetical protein